jgi:hypothetical protein
MEWHIIETEETLIIETPEPVPFTFANRKPAAEMSPRFSSVFKNFSPASRRLCLDQV